MFLEPVYALQAPAIQVDARGRYAVLSVGGERDAAQPIPLVANCLAKGRVQVAQHDVRGGANVRVDELERERDAADGVLEKVARVLRQQLGGVDGRAEVAAHHLPRLSRECRFRGEQRRPTAREQARGAPKDTTPAKKRPVRGESNMSSSSTQTNYALWTGCWVGLQSE
eukprot:594853-Pleurochrysis_carterae.AAC.11